MNQVKEYKILSIDGSKIYRKTHVAGQGANQAFNVRTGEGKLIENMFSGYLTRSIDTEKLLEIYPRYRSELKHKDYKEFMNREENPILPLLVDVYFEYSCREFNRFPSEQGARYIRFGYEVSDDEWNDHCAFRTVDGKQTLVGIEVAEKENADDADEEDRNSRRKKNKTYSPIKNNQLPAELADFFKVEAKQYRKKSKEIPYIIERANDEDYREMKAENIRRYLYREGFYLDGIHFVRYKRSAGSSRNGHCLFIAEPLKKEMMRWTRCGLRSGIESKDIVSWEAYSALTMSDMKWPLTLTKQSILIVRDQFDSFSRKVVCITEKKKDNDEETELFSEEKECEIKNRIWDGEGLLDVSCFRKLAEAFPHSKETPENRFENCGMLLLRNRFFKTCAFRTKLQDWFADNGITEIRQLNGYTEASDIRDIRLVVTNSSIKYFKLCGVNEKSPEEKFRKVAADYLKHLFEKDDTSTFGIVKTDKPTHHMEGDMVRTSYQLLSTVGLTENEVHQLYEPSKTYLYNIKSYPMFMRYYLNRIVREIPDYGENEFDGFDSYDGNDVAPDGCTAEAIMELLKYRDDFSKTQYYKDFRDSVRNSFRNRIRSGRILVNGTYATLLGNGAELLYAIINKDYRTDRSAFLKKGQIYSPKFKTGTRLLCARSPHITMGNLLLSDNTECRIYSKYFELSPEIVCVNAIDSNIQNRLNGCDYDSDTMLITDNELLIRAAERTYSEFLVPFCTLDAQKRTDVDVATVDNDIANNMIGEIVNLSQYLNAKYWDIREDDPEKASKLYEKICMLAVMSGMEIDKAKRQYNVNVQNELKKLSEEKDNKPKFYAFITGNHTKADDTKMKATMSYVYDECAESDRKEPESKLCLRDLVAFPDCNDGSNDYRYAGKIREAVEAFQKTMSIISFKQRRKKGQSTDDLRRWKQDAFEQCKVTVDRNLKTDGVLGELLKDFDGEGNHDISGYHMYLFAFVVLEKNKRFIKRILDASDSLQNLKRDEANGTVDIYGHKFKIETVSTKQSN